MLKTSDKNRILQLLKPSKKHGPVRVAYIYGNGHLVIKYERWVDGGQNGGHHVAAVKVVRFGGVELAFRGRIVVRSYGGVQHFRAALLAGLQYVHATKPTLEGGSENTKKAGIAVGEVSFGTKLAGELHHTQLSAIIGPFNYDYDQAGIDEKYEDYGDEWCFEPIVEKIDLLEPATKAA